MISETIFRKIRFNLTNQICSNVSSFSVDTLSTHTSKIFVLFAPIAIRFTGEVLSEKELPVMEFLVEFGRIIVYLFYVKNQ